MMPQMLRSYGYGKVGGINCSCMWMPLHVAALALEPVVGENLLTQDTRQVQHLDFYSVLALGFPGYPFINQFQKEG